MENADRSRRGAWLALGVYLVILGVAATFRNQGDFAIYRLAGSRALQGAALYPASDQNRFLYAPIFAIAFAPFAALPQHAAQFGWFVVNAAALVALIRGAVRMLFGPSCKLEAVLILVPTALCVRFIDNNFEHGQINILTVALIVWSIAYGCEGRARPSGMMLAAAVLTKPFAILAGWYLLLQRRWTVLIWMLAGVFILLLLPMVFFGPQLTIEQTAGYVNAVSTMGGWYRTMLTNQSASSAMIRLLSPAENAAELSQGSASAIGIVLEMVLLAGVSAWVARARTGGSDRQSRLALAAMFCLMPSFTPVSWKSYYVALTVPYAALLPMLGSKKNTYALMAWSLVAISALLNLPMPSKSLSHLELFYSVHFISSLMVLGALIASGLSERATDVHGHQRAAS